ncbi:MAG: hypothetical protein RI571_06560 [Roseovarius sp.]|nr:hypothetical protein [Roseovarius sp.]
MTSRRSFHTFDNLDEAQAYRRETGCGGWIAESTDKGECVLFPASMTATQAMRHPLAGWSSGCRLHAT